MNIKSVKDLFPGYFQPPLENIWNDCVLVIDTNVFINLLKYPENTYNTVLNIIKEYIKQERFFVPYTVCEEVIKQLDSSLREVNSAYTTIDRKIDKLKSDISTLFHGLQNQTYPISDTEEVLKIIENYSNKMKTEISLKKEKQKDIKELRKTISELLNNVGEPYSDNKKAEIIKELDYKYKKKTVPGWADLPSKEQDNKYNDGLIWYQTKDFAKEKNVNILFVTGDISEDWFNIENDKKRTQKQPIINDFMHDTNQIIHILPITDFIDEYDSRLPKTQRIDSSVKKDTLAFMSVDKTQFPSTKSVINVLQEHNKVKFKPYYETKEFKRKTHINEMVEWFLDRYEDPANMCPYCGKDGGYQYIYGGPYNAYEELDCNFGSIYSEDEIQEAVKEVEKSGTIEWSAIPKEDWTN